MWGVIYKRPTLFSLIIGDNMEWKIDLLHDAGVVSTVVSGILTLDGIKKIYTETLKRAKQNNVTKLINDYRNVSLDLSVIDIYHLPQTLLKLGRTNHHKSAIAYSINSPDKPNYAFFDTRCYNLALNTKVFTDYDDAYLWLVSDTN